MSHWLPSDLQCLILSYLPLRTLMHCPQKLIPNFWHYQYRLRYGKKLPEHTLSPMLNYIITNIDFNNIDMLNDERLVIDLCMFISKDNVNSINLVLSIIPRFYHKLIAISYQLNTDEIKFVTDAYLCRCNDILLDNLKLQADNIINNHNRSINNCNCPINNCNHPIKFRGFSGTQTLVTTTCGVKLNLIQYLVHTYWWCADDNTDKKQILQKLCKRLGDLVTLVAARSLKCVTNETDYIQLFDNINNKYKLEDLYDYFDLPDPYALSNMMERVFRIVKTRARISVKDLQIQFYSQCSISTKYNFKYILDNTIKKYYLKRDGDTIIHEW